MQNQEPKSKPEDDEEPREEGLDETTCYASSIRRWNFEPRGGEIWVCEGDHEKCESCITNSREVFAAEAIEIIEKLRRETLKLIQHNSSVRIP
jgi:hypothetical protein